jgi:hypothetical protein
MNQYDRVQVESSRASVRTPHHAAISVQAFIVVFGKVFYIGVLLLLTNNYCFCRLIRMLFTCYYYKTIPTQDAKRCIIAYNTNILLVLCKCTFMR